MEKIENELLEKSKEAFIMAIELYNKPTIKYRVEGFSLFICNAWELMLKSHMIKKYIYWYDCRVYAIYYSSINTIYYNLDFNGATQLIICK